MTVISYRSTLAPPLFLEKLRVSWTVRAGQTDQLPGVLVEDKLSICAGRSRVSRGCGSSVTARPGAMAGAVRGCDIEIGLTTLLRKRARARVCAVSRGSTTVRGEDVRLEYHAFRRVLLDTGRYAFLPPDHQNGGDCNDHHEGCDEKKDAMKWVIRAVWIINSRGVPSGVQGLYLRLRQVDACAGIQGFPSAAGYCRSRP